MVLLVVVFLRDSDAKIQLDPCFHESAALKQICKDYHDRVYMCESQKWDLDFEVRKKDYEVSHAAQLSYYSLIHLVASYYRSISSLILIFFFFCLDFFLFFI